jgi:hypothetical protein
MALLVYNKSASPIVLSGLAVTVPASAAPPARGPGVNVTSELRSLSGAQYTALEAQRALGSLDYEWTGAPEYATGSLFTTATGSISVVANKAALAAVDGALLEDHTEIFVTTYLQPWIIEKTSAAALVDDTVIAAVGGGRWFRKLVSHPVWTNQIAWEQHSGTGNNEATGAPGFPVKDLAEICRRLREVNTSLYTITCLAPVLSTDRVRLTLNYAATAGALDGVNFTFVGSRAVIFAGAFTATSDTVTATNSQATVTDAAAPWAANLGRHLVMTSGPAVGATAVILRDLGAGVARVSEWIFEATGIFPVFPATPIPGDTYNIVSELSFAAPIQLQGTDTEKTAVVFNQFQIDTALVTPRSVDVRFVGCRHTVAPNPPSNGFFGSVELVMTGCAWFFATPTRFALMVIGRLEITGGGAVNTRLECLALGSVRANKLVMNGGSLRSGVAPNPGQTGQFIVSTNLPLGLFDAPAGEPALLLNRGTTAAINATIYGSGNLHVGVDVRNGSRLWIAAGITPSIVGAVADVRLDEAATAMPALEPSAGLVLPALSALTTWAHWAAAPFSRNVVSYKTGSAITNLN